MGYKYRHRETYKGVSIDIKANSTGEFSEKLKEKAELTSGDILTLTYTNT